MIDNGDGRAKWSRMNAAASWCTFIADADILRVPLTPNIGQVHCMTTSTFVYVFQRMFLLQSKFTKITSTLDNFQDSRLLTSLIIQVDS